jgi:hypothetical protein
MFNEISIFGYPIKSIFRRIRYYGYLKITWLIFKTPFCISSTYGHYIDKKKFINNFYTTSESVVKRIKGYSFKRPSADELNNIIQDKTEIFNYCIFDKKNISRIDPVSGHVWEKSMWYRDARKNLTEGTDIKRPWEYSRLYHIVIIAKEYSETKDERLVKKIIEEVFNWDDDNILCSAPNWSCTMEVAIRLANIVLAYQLTCTSSLLDPHHDRIIEIIENHIGFTYNNLENISKITSNHYCANIAGLYCALCNFPLTKKGKKILSFSKNELEKEILIQTLEDGWNFELSSAYHRLVFEFFFYPLFLSNKDVFSQEYFKKLYSMNKVFNNLCKPNGDMVQSGDNDSGRFLLFQNYAMLGGLQAGDQTDFYNNFFNYQERLGFFSYNDADVYGYKSNNLYLLVKGGRKGQSGYGGHSHNDTFNIDLQVNNKDILIDPGTGSYTSNKYIRNYFRSNSNHNSVFWEDMEESDIEKGLFYLTQENSYSIKDESSQSEFIVSGINNYKDRWHKRRVKFDSEKKTIYIYDKVSHENAKIKYISTEKIEQVGNNSLIIAGVLFEWKIRTCVIINHGYISSKYGVIKESNTATISIPGKEFHVSIRLP